MNEIIFNNAKDNLEIFENEYMSIAEKYDLYSEKVKKSDVIFPTIYKKEIDVTVHNLGLDFQDSLNVKPVRELLHILSKYPSFKYITIEYNYDDKVEDFGYSVRFEYKKGNDKIKAEYFRDCSGSYDENDNLLPHNFDGIRVCGECSHKLLEFCDEEGLDAYEIVPKMYKKLFDCNTVDINKTYICPHCNKRIPKKVVKATYVIKTKYFNV